MIQEKMRVKTAKIVFTFTLFKTSWKEKASWCIPCREENKKLVEAVSYTHLYLPVSNVSIPFIEYDNTGNHYAYLTIFNNKKWEAIAFSKIEDKKAIFTEMGLSLIHILHVCDTNEKGESVARKYNVTAIPHIFVLDSSNKIIAENVRGKELEKVVKENLE